MGVRWPIERLREAGFEIDPTDPHRGRRIEPQPPLPLDAPSPPPPLPAVVARSLGRETDLQCKIVRLLRPRLVAGARLLSLNGELPGGDLRGQRDDAFARREKMRFIRAQVVRRSMGYEKGTPDLLVIRPIAIPDAPSGLTAQLVLFIEVKTERGDPDMLGRRTEAGRLHPEQRAFRDWCQMHGYGWTLARSVADAETALVRCGFISLGQ